KCPRLASPSERTRLHACKSGAALRRHDDLQAPCLATDRGRDRAKPGPAAPLLAPKRVVALAFVFAVALFLLFFAKLVVRVVRPLLLRLEILLVVLAHAGRMSEMPRLQSVAELGA